MDFKIDTKSNYTLITPVEPLLNAILADQITEECQKLQESSAANFIIDLQACKDADTTCFPKLLDLHEHAYTSGQSLVFIHVQDNVMLKMKQEQLHLTLNIAPTLIEAVDIINMEILERDLFNEE